MPTLTVHQHRNGLVETVHPCSAVVVGEGRVRWSAGPDVSTFWRSASKPLQLLVSLDQLPDDVVDALADEDLAVGTASHSGQPDHVSRVSSLLGQFSFTMADLRCGGHWPTHEGSKKAMLAGGHAYSALHNNCSGKHTFMCAAAQARGWDPDYLPLAHPLQALNRAVIEEWGGVTTATGVDGCGIPTFHAPLSSMARTFARLAAEMRDPGSRAGRIGRAMAAHPWLVSGDGRLDLAFTRGSTEPLACKVGAEGLFCIAVPGRDMGIAVKCHTGQDAALAVAVRKVCDEVAPGLLAPDAWPWDVVKNVVGREVGHREALLEADHG